jgi:L-threonylcarbamoyladenylate synthase
MILKLSDETLEEALHLTVSVLMKGGIVAYPTETFYALGVRFDDEVALIRLYEIKRRPKDKTMPLIIGEEKQLNDIAKEVNASAQRLMQRFWPGPLTLVFNAVAGLSEFITADGKVAARVPGRSFALALAQRAGFPITATSANTSGKPPADCVEMVGNYFPECIDLIIDAGDTRGGLPSTIVDVTGDAIKVLREGAVAM